MKIAIIFNHLQYQDGVCKAAIGMANALAERNESITLIPLFRYDETVLNSVSPKVSVKPVFRCFFRGFPRIVELIPKKILYNKLIGNDYDIVIGYCMKLPIKIVAESDDNNIQKLAWMHGYDTGLTLFKEYKKIGHVICVSQYAADKLKSESRQAFQVSYAYNLVNDAEIIEQGKAAISIPRKKYQFVTVGRITPEKGYVRLVEVIGRLSRFRKDFGVWIIGDGPERAAVEKKIKDLDLSDCVQMLGVQKNPHAYTSKCDLFICSSFSEGYSTACTEAAILGTPIITTSVPGGKEIIETAECGMLVGMEDNDLLEGLEVILENPALLEEWKKTLSVTKERFSYKSRANRIYSLLGIK